MNKKGITLIEIIISIVLISIVLILLFSLLISVQDINYESRVNSTYLINKSLMIKNIEEDFDKANTIHIDKCKIEEDDFYKGYGKSVGTEHYFPQLSGGGDDPIYTANNCLKFIYNKGTTDQSVAFLGIYYYNSKKMYVISYVHGTHKSTRTLPEFETIPANLHSLENNKWLHNDLEINNTYFEGGCSPNTSNCNLTNDKFHNIYIPIMGSDGKDYSLNISYYKETP